LHIPDPVCQPNVFLQEAKVNTFYAIADIRHFSRTPLDAKKAVLELL
jgi:hypothetical protein